LEQSLEEVTREAPLAAFIPSTIVDGSRVVAEIGSVDDDPIGRLIQHTKQHLAFSTSWLSSALDRAKERHTLVAADFTAWVNRCGLFGDARLLSDGIAAWIAEDHVKAAHLLIPQIEAAFRTLVGRCGRPTTKPHPRMRRARMVITMGDILFDEETVFALGQLGSDLVLHFRALYADPRGYNWRNDLAHGLIPTEQIGHGMLLWVIHTLLLLGVWMKPENDAPATPLASPPEQ
jgi:lysyl-tRNA synthetase class 1